MKKGDIMKIYFIKYKVILIEWKYISISYEFLFLQHFSNRKRCKRYREKSSDESKVKDALKNPEIKKMNKFKQPYLRFY